MAGIEATIAGRAVAAAAPAAATRHGASTALAPSRWSGRQTSVACAVSAASSLALPGPTAQHRLWVALLAFAAIVLVLAACASATASHLAWRSEQLLRAVVGGAMFAAALGVGATVAGVALAPEVIALTGLAAAFSAVAATGGKEREFVIDLREGADAQVVPAASVLPPLCRGLKRAVDLLGSVVAIVLFSPFVAMLAVLISRESPGGWLFKQTRVGQGGRHFTLWKLRTMTVANDDSHHRAYTAALIAGQAPPSAGELFKITDDPRVTRTGRWLRRLSLDELPQLVNVLRGDMSLVGPRPPLPAEADLYNEWSRLRLACKPGMTGLWQVSGRSRLSFEEMVELDVTYWRNWSMRLELGILARTARAVVRGETA